LNIENSKNDLISNAVVTNKNISGIYQSDLNNNKSDGKNDSNISNSNKLSNLNLKNGDQNNENFSKEILKSQIISGNEENISLSYKVSNLTDLMYKLNYNTCIEKIIDTLNSILMEEKKQLFDKNDFNITLKKHEFDKFFNVDDVDDDFMLNIKYSLMCQNKNFN